MNGKTILLVEDEALIAMSEAATLKRYGAKVLTAFNAQEAVALAATTPEIDLVLMDIDLGHGQMDGTQAAQLILQGRDLPLIFLSGHTEREVVEKTEGITSYGYIVKHSGETVMTASIKMAFKLHAAHLALQRTNEKLGLAQEASYAGAWEWDLGQGRLDWSPEYRKLFGLAAETPASFETLAERMHPDDRQAAIHSLEQAVAQPCDLLHDFRIVLPSGEVRWIRATGKTYYGGEQPLRMLGLCLDITRQKQMEAERLQAEEKLAQSHELLTNLARLVPSVIYQYRLYPDGRSAFPYASPGMNMIYEVTPEQVREDATPVFGRLHPEDYDYVSSAIQESARTLEEFFCEFRVLLPRQGLRWRWSQAHPERTADGGTLWHGIISDITERKQAEALLRQQTEELERFFSIALELLCIADLEGRLLRVNQEWGTVFGYALDELEGQRYIDFVHPDDRAETLAAMRALVAQQNVLNFINRYRCKDGSYRWIEWRSTPRGQRVYAAARDITRHVEMEVELRRGVNTKHE